jgi:hypothetical protein
MPTRAPLLLLLRQVTFCPGVERPMAGDPAFFDKLFGCLFRVREALVFATLRIFAFACLHALRTCSAPRCADAVRAQGESDGFEAL